MYSNRKKVTISLRLGIIAILLYIVTDQIFSWFFENSKILIILSSILIVGGGLIYSKRKNVIPLSFHILGIILLITWAFLLDILAYLQTLAFIFLVGAWIIALIVRCRDG